MNLHYDKETGRANEVVEEYIANFYRKAIEKIVTHLSLELARYNNNDTIPKDVLDRTHQFIEKIRNDFTNNTLVYYFSNEYINLFDCKTIYKSFNESVGQLEDLYLYKTIYKKSDFHYCD